MEKLEDTLLKLKFDRNADDDYSCGQREAIRFCLRKHKEGWSLDDFYKELHKVLSDKKCSEYTQGIISGFKYNIKIMEDNVCEYI